MFEPLKMNLYTKFYITLFLIKKLLQLYNDFYTYYIFAVHGKGQNIKYNFSYLVLQRNQNYKRLNCLLKLE